MTIQRDIPIEIDALEVMQALSRGRRDPSWMAEPARAALERAQNLFDPMILYDWVALAGLTADTATVNRSGNESAHLRIGPNAHLLGGAQEALIFVSSIGRRLDEDVRELNHKGEVLESYLLDCVGVVALSKVSEFAARMAENRAREQGWGVGARIGPGSLVGWPVHHQRELCAILPLAEAGISLTDSGLLMPFKSASSLIGIGPGYRDATVGSVCGLCTLREKCWRRKY